LYFGSAWKKAFLSSREKFVRFANRTSCDDRDRHHLHGPQMAIESTAVTASRTSRRDRRAIQQPELIAVAGAGSGLLILIIRPLFRPSCGRRPISLLSDSIAIRRHSGPLLPFRGFSRSGSTISWAGFAAWRGSRSRIQLRPWPSSCQTRGDLGLKRADSCSSRPPPSAALHRPPRIRPPASTACVFSFLAGLVRAEFSPACLEKVPMWIFAALLPVRGRSSFLGFNLRD